MTADEVLRAARHREDLTPGATAKLLETLEWIESVLAEIDRGAGFCEDRGYGWGHAEESNSAARKSWPGCGTGRF